MVQPLCRTIIKLKMYFLHSPLLCVYFREIKSCYDHKMTGISTLQNSLTYNSLRLETAHLSINRSIVLQYIHTMDQHSAMKTNEWLMHIKWAHLIGILLTREPRLLSKYVRCQTCEILRHVKSILANRNQTNVGPKGVLWLGRLQRESVLHFEGSSFSGVHVYQIVIKCHQTAHLKCVNFKVSYTSVGLMWR